VRRMDIRTALAKKRSGFGDEGCEGVMLMSKRTDDGGREGLLSTQSPPSGFFRSPEEWAYLSQRRERVLIIRSLGAVSADEE
jgi:hypothetical protein